MVVNKKKILIVLGAAALFFAYAWFPMVTGDLWNAPDEGAAAFFATNFPVIASAYDVPASYVNELGGIVHPRSMNVVGGQLVPNMWLGLPWFLSVARNMMGLSSSSLDIMIPIIAVLAVLAWQQVILKMTSDPKIAWFTAVAFAVHPGWWYFTARGLHPNVLFVSMIIFAIYFWFVMYGKKIELKYDVWNELAMFSGGAAIGMAIFIRTNAMIWIVPILFLVAWKARKLPFKELAAAAVGLLIPMVIMIQFNAAIFGSAFVNGYSVEVDPAIAQVELVEAEQSMSPLMRYVFPFGIHEMNILRNVWNFHFAFFALWSFFALYGFLLVVFRWKTFPVESRKGMGILFAVTAAVCAYLLVLYGSWNLNDNPDPRAITIGTSYIRYWLPVTLAMSPFIGYAIATGFVKGRSEARKTILSIIWIGAMVMSGIHMTYVGQDEGLLFVEANLRSYESERELILEMTGEDDIVIVDRSDKILFPSRHVVVSLRSETTYASLPLMIDAVEDRGASLYYYGISLPEDDLIFLRETRLDTFGLEITIVEEIGEKTLYIFSKE